MKTEANRNLRDKSYMEENIENGYLGIQFIVSGNAGKFGGGGTKKERREIPRQVLQDVLE